MKKVFTSLILVLTISVCAVMLSACADDVVDERDLYGSFLTEGATRSITLSADNVAVVCYGENTEQYYARYDFLGNVIEFRQDGFRGDIVYTIKIVDVDTLQMVFTPTEGEGAAQQETITFIRDKSYDPTV